MKNQTTGLGPQYDRKKPAELTVIEWEFQEGAGGELVPVYGEKGLEHYHQETVEYLPAEKKARPVADWTVDTGYWVSIASTTWKVAQYLAPWAILLGLIYGGYVLLAWLVEQTLFWIIVGAGGVLFVLGAAIFPGTGNRDRRTWADSQPMDRPGSQVITNVHVHSQQPGQVVLTNVFVNSEKNESDELDSF